MSALMDLQSFLPGKSLSTAWFTADKRSLSSVNHHMSLEMASGHEQLLTNVAREGATCHATCYFQFHVQERRLARGRLCIGN